MSTNNDAPKATDSFMGPVMFGLAVVFMTFGVAGGWAAVAPLDSAVVAPGVVAVENNRRLVQHFEGGIISEILVQDGHKVEEGTVLFRLDTTRAKATEAVERLSFFSARVLEARLIAELDGQSEINLPEDILKIRDEPTIAQAIKDQTAQFMERKNSINGQIDILRARVKQAHTRVEGLNKELESTKQQIGYINEELTGVRLLYERGLVSMPRLHTLERERGRLEGVIGRTIAEISGAETSAGEAELQIHQIQQERLERTAEQIVDARKTINELNERLTVSSDVLRRTAILAPRSGKVLNLKVFTIGQVVRAGETLLEIVPDDEGMVISAHVSPMDIDKVLTGMNAEVRFTGMKVKETPVVYGRVREISPDRLVDENTRQPYFLVRVVVAENDIPEILQGRLTPGMPSDIILPTGERTVLQYLIQPMQTALAYALREE